VLRIDQGPYGHVWKGQVNGIDRAWIGRLIRNRLTTRSSRIGTSNQPPMASASIQPIVSAGIEIIKDVKGFSRKHRARYFQYATERDRLLDRITQVRVDHELDRDEEKAFVENRERYENLGLTA
jgi:hypothetical protein